MWLSKRITRRAAMLGAVSATAACGFQPVLAPGGIASQLSGKVVVAAPQTEEGFLLRRDLETRLGRSTTELYRLEVDPRTSAQGQAVTAAGEITRFSLVGEATYKLVRIADGQVVASGKVDNFTGSSATGSTVETLAAENSARERLMTILADQIVARLFSLRAL